MALAHNGNLSNGLMFAVDAQYTGRKLDEAFKAFIMLGSAMIYSAVMLGPWGFLKSAAYNIGSPEWLIYAAAFLKFIFLALPGLFYAAVALGQMLSGEKGRRAAGRKNKLISTYRQSFIAFAYSLVPVGLAAWIAFSLSFGVGEFVVPVAGDVRPVGGRFPCRYNAAARRRRAPQPVSRR